MSPDLDDSQPGVQLWVTGGPSRAASEAGDERFLDALEAVPPDPGAGAQAPGATLLSDTHAGIALKNLSLGDASTLCPPRNISSMAPSAPPVPVKPGPLCPFSSLSHDFSRTCIGRQCIGHAAARALAAHAARRVLL